MSKLTAWPDSKKVIKRITDHQERGNLPTYNYDYDKYGVWNSESDYIGGISGEIGEADIVGRSIYSNQGYGCHWKLATRVR